MARPTMLIVYVYVGGITGWRTGWRFLGVTGWFFPCENRMIHRMKTREE